MISRESSGRDRYALQAFGLLALTAVTIVIGALIAGQPELAGIMLGAAGAIGYALLCLSQPFAAFVILVFFALTVVLSGVKVAGGISAMIGLGLVFTLLWLTRMLLRSTAFAKVKEYQWLAALALVVFVSTALHLDGRAGFTAVFTYLQLFLLFILVINLTTTPARLSLLGNVIIFSSGILAALILLDQIGWLPAELIPEQTTSMAPGVQTTVARTAGLWGDANFTALQLTIALPFIVAWWSAASLARRVLLLSSGIAILAAFVWTFSMGGLLGISVMLLVRMLMAPQHHRLFAIARNGLIGVIALAAFLAFAPELFLQRVVILFESDVSALVAFDRSSLLTIGTLRGDAWWAALQAIAASPLLGYGPGNGIYATASYSILRSRTFLSSHNMFLAVAGDLGLIGLVFFVALFISALQAVRSRPDTTADAAGLPGTRQALFIALIGLAVQGMALEIHHLKLLWILIGMAIAYRELPGRSIPKHAEVAP